MSSRHFHAVPIPLLYPEVLVVPTIWQQCYFHDNVQNRSAVTWLVRGDASVKICSPEQFRTGQDRTGKDRTGQDRTVVFLCLSVCLCLFGSVCLGLSVCLSLSVCLFLFFCPSTLNLGYFNNALKSSYLPSNGDILANFPFPRYTPTRHYYAHTTWPLPLSPVVLLVPILLSPQHPPVSKHNWLPSWLDLSLPRSSEFNFVDCGTHTQKAIYSFSTRSTSSSGTSRFVDSLNNI